MTVVNEVGATDVTILGGRGFLGSAIAARLGREGVRTRTLGRVDGNLLEQHDTGLIAILRSSRAVVFCAAQAPAHTPDDVVANAVMARNLVSSLRAGDVGRLIVISSDSVYGDISGVLDENSPTAPNTLHGLAHLTRELICQSSDVPSQAVIRPSAIYGIGDPHNAYGPNRFVRSALATGRIPLLGRGSAERDHVAVEDVAELTWRVIATGAEGPFNAVSGECRSFRDVAALVQSSAPFPCTIEIVGDEAPPTMRAFAAGRVYEEWPDYRTRSLTDGIEQLFAAHRAGAEGMRT